MTLSPQYFIYGLFDPEDHQLRYIGQSSIGMTRPRRHRCAPARSFDTHISRWLSALYKKGLFPETEILETQTSKEDLDEAEIRLIEYYTFIGCRLTNHTRGGNGLRGWKHNDKVKISIARTKGTIPFQDQYGNVYHSYKDAAKRTGCAGSCIKKVLLGKKHRVNDYVFGFLDSPPPVMDIRLIVDQFGVTYRSIREVAQITKSGYTTISAHLRVPLHQRRPTKGRLFQYADEISQQAP